MAVGVVIGAAFAGACWGVHQDLLTPLIAAIVGKPHFSAILFTINGRVFALGDFLNAAISFLLVAAAVYFFVVTPVNLLVARMRKAPAPVDPTTKKCSECRRDPDRRPPLRHCAQPVVHAARAAAEGGG